METKLVETRTTKHITARVGEPKSGGIEIAFSVEGEGKATPSTILLRFFSVDDVQAIEIAPEDLERAAELMRRARWDALIDGRQVCVVHGYHDGRGRKGYGCAECESAEAEYERLRAEQGAANPQEG